MLVLVVSAIFYDTSNIINPSNLKLATQIAAIGTITLSILDHGYARFFVPNILKKSHTLWTQTLNIVLKEITKEDFEKLNIARVELHDSQKSYSTWIQVFVVFEIILALLAIGGELILIIKP